jgi:hypothetical protein
MEPISAKKCFSAEGSCPERLLTRSLHSLGKSCHLIGLAVILVALTTACDRRPQTPQETPDSGEQRTFTGRLTAAGSRQLMQLEQGHEVAVFRLTGSLLLEGEQRLRKGFHADLLGFSDNRSGLVGRSVWTDEQGEHVFSDLKGGPDIVGTAITGTFMGGTGRYAGVTGEYTFKWQRLTSSEDGEISGRVVDFQGWARLTSPQQAQSAIGVQQ